LLRRNCIALTWWMARDRLPHASRRRRSPICRWSHVTIRAIRW
jgi:hypothetical protein